jgi:flagellar hook assembly protein FlgD
VSPTITPTTDRFYAQDKLIKVRGLYPNPFSDKLRVYYTLRVASDVKMHVYNVAGEPIWTFNVSAKAGKNEIVWAGENESGGRCATGAYVLRLEAKGVDGTEDSFWERAAVSR